MKQIKIWILTAMGLTFLVQCAPKIYVIDHHTLMQEEAAGNWPDFDVFVNRKTGALIPQPEPSEKKKNLTRVLKAEIQE